MSETIRTLTVDDVPAAVQLSTLAGWNQTARDWRLLLDLSPDGCFAVEAGGRVVATASLLGYGNRLGWIGMVLTHPEYRHRGFAKRLFCCVLDHADSRGIRTLKLDATDQGQPLYESYSFKPEQPVERWFRPASKDSEHPGSNVDCSDCLDRDTNAFGADRTRLLQKLRQQGKLFTNPDAYVLTRPGRVSAYLGPCVARGREAARDVLVQAVSDSETNGTFWDLLPSNRGAVELAGELGFSPQRHLVRMFRGEELRSRDELIYAIAGFELG